MPTDTYTPLISVTVPSATPQVVLSGIPQSYRDLRLVVRMTSNGGDGLVGIQFNSDTGSNYINVGAYGEAPSTKGSWTDTRAYIVGSITSVSSTNPTTLRVELIDSNQTDKHKTVLVRNDYPAENTSMLAGRWANTAAITSIRLYFTGTGQFAAGSTFYLHGMIA